MKNMEKSF